MPTVTQPTKLPAKPRPWWMKVSILGILNVLCIIAIFVFNTQVHKKAEELSKLNQAQRVSQAQNDIEVIKEELQKYKSQSDTLLSKYVDDDSLLSLADKLHELKTSGAITQFSFPSEEKVKDKLGVPGFVIAIELSGNTEVISSSFQKLSELPYIFRPIKLEVVKKSGEQIYTIKYGIFVYAKTN